MGWQEKLVCVCVCTAPCSMGVKHLLMVVCRGEQVTPHLLGQQPGKQLLGCTPET